MKNLEKRLEALEKAGGNAKALVWIDHKNGGITCDGVFYPDEASLRQSLGLSEKDMLIGWEKDEDITIFRMPDNGRDTLEAEGEQQAVTERGTPKKGDVFLK